MPDKSKEAAPAEVIVTPEMLDAGENIINKLSTGEIVGHKAAAEAMYRAMAEAAPRTAAERKAAAKAADDGA